MRAKRERERRGMPVVIKAILISLGLLALIFAAAGAALYSKWQRADYLTAEMFQANASGSIPVLKMNRLDESPDRTSSAGYESGTITYDGRKYKYNDNLINILLMGIDDYGINGEAEDANPYQADTLVLGSVDAVKKTVSFISIPRDTVTTVKVLDLNDCVAAKRKGPIAIQHSFGSQGAGTDEAVAESVSELLYNVPIYRYVAVDVSAIPDINDSLGGIDVDIPEDLTKWNPAMKEGVTDYHLMGDDALVFVARRDTSIDDSAMGRMKRQVQYLKQLFPAMKDKTAENLTYPITLYKNEAGKVSTNLSVDEMTYLAKLMLDLDLNEDQIATVPGQMQRIEPGQIEGYEFEMGYIVDEDALKQLVIDRFYEDVSSLQ